MLNQKLNINIYEHAVALYANKECTHVAAYLRREDARHVKELFNSGVIHDTCYVRAKDSPVKFNKFKGPMQLVSIGFKMKESKEQKLAELMQSNPSAFYKIF